MIAIRALALTALLASACAGPAPEPEEVTTTVTEGDEEAWSEPDDPPIDGEEGEPADDDEMDP